MSGVIEVGEHLSIREAIEDLPLIAEAASYASGVGRFVFFPLS